MKVQFPAEKEEEEEVIRLGEEGDSPEHPKPTDWLGLGAQKVNFSDVPR